MVEVERGHVNFSADQDKLGKILTCQTLAQKAVRKPHRYTVHQVSCTPNFFPGQSFVGTYLQAFPGSTAIQKLIHDSRVDGRP